MYTNARVMTIIPEKGSKDKEVKNSPNVIRIAKKNMILHLSGQNSKKERIDEMKFQTRIRLEKNLFLIREKMR